MFSRFAFFGGLALASAGLAQQPADPAQLYGARESVEQIDISPDGNRVVYLQGGTGRETAVYISDLSTEAQPRLILGSDGDPERLRWCRFLTNDRLICRITGTVPVDSVLASFSRLVSVDTNGQNLTMLGQRSSFYDARLRQFDGSILDWLSPTDGAILMSLDHVPEIGRTGSRLSRTENGLGVVRLDARTLGQNQVEPANPRAGAYLSDGRGSVRMMMVPQTRQGLDRAQIDYFYRTEGSRDWRPFGSYNTQSSEGMYPLAVDRELNAAYVLKKLNGRMALYRVKLDGTLATELVYSNEQVDVDNVVRTSRNSRVIGVTFAEEQRRAIYFDPAYAGLSRSLSRAIPNLPLIDFGGTSADGNRTLVHAGSDSDPGRYFVYDRATRALNEILVVRPQLENVPTATVRSLTYPAADGTRIPAYLTLPPNVEARNLPVVILPHGGPSSRDEWGFDWLAQYLAHQGYAVLQANYRGSAGYGDAWLQQNGFRSWRTSIGDISAGARWLASEGIGDSNRMAIVGWSYGGYAALQAGATDPGLFKAIVAVAPVTDLQQLKDDARDYTNARNVAEFVGTGPHIREGSPLQNARAITAPVLLVHGTRDINVNIIHSRRMDGALRDAGRTSELIVFEGLEHDLADTRARVQMLTRLETFLTSALGPRSR